MVFSPQSAPPPAEPVKASAEPVIETRPPATETPVAASTIQPSKPLSSIVEVVTSSNGEPKKAPPPPEAPKPPTTPPPAPKTTTSAPKTTPTAPKTTPAAPKTTPAAPKTTPAAPKTTPAAPKTTPAAPKTAPAAPPPPPPPVKPSDPSPPVILSSIVEVRTSGGPSSESTLEAANKVPSTPGGAAEGGEEEDGEEEEGGASNQVGGEFYNFLSRQPSEIVEETYKVIGLKPSSKVNIRSKTRQSVEIRSRVNVVTQTDVKTRVASASATLPSHSKGHNHHHGHHNGRPGKAHNKGHNSGRAGGGNHHDEDPYPTGLVTKMGGTMVADGITTVHETSVVGTFISGKYAQILQSTSHIYPRKDAKPVLINASPSQRILKTAAPDFSRRHGSSSPPVIDATPAAASAREEQDALQPLEAVYPAPANKPQITFSPTQRRPGGAQRTDFLSKLNRGRPSTREEGFKDRSSTANQEQPEERKKSGYGGGKRSQQSSPRATRTSQALRPSKRFNNSRFGRTSSTTELATVSVFSDSPVRASSTSGGRRFSRSRSGGFRPTTAAAAPAPSTYSYNSRSEPEASNYGSGRRGGFKPRNSQSSQSSYHDHNHGIQASGAAASAPTTSLYKFKLARPTGRWQYKTSPKPRISIRRQSDEEAGGQGSQGDLVALQAGYEEDEDDVGVPGAVKKVVTVVTSGGEEREALVDDVQATPSSAAPTPPALTEETINVEISTPADFKNVYYEVATIKSPYTFQVGTVKNTRFITVTSTQARNLETSSTASPAFTQIPSGSEPLTENILAATATQPLRYENLLPDASIATLPAVTLTDPSMPTPPLETMTETFNTTQLLLKTHVLPVVRRYDGDTNLLETATTSHMTLVQSYHVTRLVTAIKTLPPTELFHFVASKRLKEFNTKLEEAGSELLESELEIGENDNEDDEPALRLVLPPDLDLANVGSEFDVTAAERARKTSIPAASSTSASAATSMTTPQLSPEQLQQLALLRLLNPGAAPQIITTSRPVLKLETLYESHVIPVWNGATTLFSTISRPIATVSKTEFEYGTTVAPGSLPSAVIPPPQPLIPNNPFLPQPQFTITSQPVVQQTMVTSTDSKILKLTFGAKTVYSTLYSTKVVPTVVTTYVTTSAPVAPVVAPAFPGYFPGGYAGFPAFVG